MKSIAKRHISLTLMAIAASAVTSCSGCRPVPPPTPLSVDGPKCKVTSSQTRPLIVEWSGMDRTDLEASMRQGMIAVHYKGCELEVLRQCKLPESNYRWVKTTREEELIKMDDVDQLYAKMPLAGPSLEAHFQQGNALSLSTTVIGKFVASQPSIGFDDLQKLGSDCARATHVVVGVTAGAFEMSTTSKVEAGAKAASFAGGETKTERGKLRKSGRSSACDQAKKDDVAPPDDCGSLLRLELAPVKCSNDLVFKEGVGCIEDIPGEKGDETLAGDPRDFRLAKFIRRTGRTLLDAYHNKKTDPRWHCLGRQDIQEPVRDEQNLAKQLGKNVDIVFSVLEFNLVARGKSEPVRLQAIAFVFPDGRLKWAGLTPHPDSGPSFDALFPVSEYPELRVGLDRLVSGVKQCQVTMAEASDFLSLPIPQSSQLDLANQTTKSTFEFRKWCSRMPEVTSEWRVGMQIAGIAVVGNGKFGLIDAEPERQDHDFCLKPAQLREK